MTTPKTTPKTTPTPTPLATPVHFIGCDVGKTSIVIFDGRSGQTKTVLNQARYLAEFAATLDHNCLAICEATGGHELILLAALVKAGCPAHRADARKVKAFIRSFGTLGKTDAIDARALARYGEERHARLVPWQSPDLIRVRLQALVLMRRELVADRVAYKNRLSAPGAGDARRHLDKVLACLIREIKDITREIVALIRDHRLLNQASQAICGITGIGETTAAALLALMPELGTLDRRKVAALSGLAPHPKQSGGNDAYRRTRGGRPEIKRVLFMAAMVAAKHDPKQRDFYQRLLASGKKKLVALTAVMRKLIIICNAVLKLTFASAMPDETMSCG